MTRHTNGTHEYASGTWAYEPVKRHKPWLTGRQFWLICILCIVTIISANAAEHYWTGLIAEEVGVSYD